MPYITHIHIENCRNVKELDVDLSVPAEGEDGPASSEQEKRPFRHLILTGPNGSGKSGILAAVAAEVEEAFKLRNRQLSLFNTKENTIQWACDPRLLPSMFEKGDIITAYLPARRAIQPQEVRGPSKINRRKLDDFGPAYDAGASFQQFIVNKHVEMTYAIADGNWATASEIESWLRNFEEYIRQITEDDGLSANYDPKAFAYAFRRSDGHVFDLNTLADGHAAMLAVLAELSIRLDSVKSKRRDYTFVPAGIIIVDELETHLHPSLQEKILPFLTDIFPSLQFIVATHSPAVIASIPGAVVYDLGKRKQFLSDHYRGIPYGVLMTEHFGISSDIDLDSTEKLLRFRALAEKAARAPEEEREMHDLGVILSVRSQLLATEVWMIKEKLGVSHVELAGE